MLNLNMIFNQCVVFIWMLSMFSSVNNSQTKKVELDKQEETRFETYTVKPLLFFNYNTTNLAYGFVANIAAAVLFGSSYVPIKRIDTGDGNVAVVSIVKAIGLGLGVLIWGSGSLLMGWASSRFGWFGIDPQHVSSPLLNYCGAGLCFLSGLTFFFVRTDVEAHPHAGSPLLHPDRSNVLHRSILQRVRSGCEPSESWIEVIGPETKRFIGCSLATAYGLLDGLSFVPILYIKSWASCQDSVFYGASLYDPDYVYAQCCGIFLTSTVYFLIYCALMTNRPQVPSRAVLPGFPSGLMWTLANYCCFLANIYLSSMVTFSIVTAGYGLVAALWGCLVFREIKGWGNCCILILASCICLIGSILTALSKTQ